MSGKSEVFCSANVSDGLYQPAAALYISESNACVDKSLGSLNLSLCPNLASSSIDGQDSKICPLMLFYGFLQHFSVLNIFNFLLSNTTLH